MSKLITNTLRHTAGSADNITLDSSQNVTVEGNLTVDGTTVFTGDCTLPDDTVDIADLSATGTASATTFLRGDNTWAATSGHSVLEQFFCVCDGSTIALTSGNRTVQDVTEDMFLTNTWTDITGSTIAYTPPSGAKQVIYEFHYACTPEDANIIFHTKLFLDSDEVNMARMSFRANDSFTDRIVQKWAFNIGGTAATASGRVASWTSDKTMKMQAREMSTGNEAYLHRLTNWDGSTTDVEAPDAAMPCIGITAIG